MFFFFVQVHLDPLVLQVGIGLAPGDGGDEDGLAKWLAPPAPPPPTQLKEPTAKGKKQKQTVVAWG